MDTQTLIEALRGLSPSAFDWTFALYSVQKSRDGLALDFGRCKMQGIAPWVDTLRETLLKKSADDRTVTPYSPFLPKEAIGALSVDDEMIREQIGEILAEAQNALIYAPESFVNGTLPNPAGHVFYGVKTDREGNIAEQVLFMRRQNPFITGAKARLCEVAGDAVTQSEKPLLKFMPSTDFLLIGGVCYFISASIEKDFGMENRHKAICAKRMQLVAESGLASRYDELEQAALSPKNARKFIDFDEDILRHIARLPILERMDFLSTYGITTDEEGRMDTRDPEQCELIIDLLCCRSCLDALGRLAVGHGITLR